MTQDEAGPGLSRRQALQLTAAGLTGTALAGWQLRSAPAAGAAGPDPASAGGLGPVSAVSRSADRLDVFAAGADGFVWTAAWQPGDLSFRGWWRVGDLEVPPCSAVTAVSRSADRLDVFATGLDGRIWTAAWAPGDAVFRPWARIGDLTAVAGAEVGAVSRAPGLLDVVAAGADGYVYAAAWQPGDTAWRGWWRIGDRPVPPRTVVGVVSRSANKLDVFAAGLDGAVSTAAWEPGDPAWRGWWPCAGLSTRPGGPVAAVSRSADKLDVFATGTDGRVRTAAWQPGDPAWRGNWQVSTLLAPAAAPVGVVSRSTDRLDVFVTGTDGRLSTAAWKPGDPTFGAPTAVTGTVTRPGTPVRAVSRSRDLMDVFSTAADATVLTAAWQPGDPAFRGPLGIPRMLTGLSDPQVSAWRKVGVALTWENHAGSVEGQGVATDGFFWYLVSNGSKRLYQIGNDGREITSFPLDAAQTRSSSHAGAPGFHDGWLYVPVQNPHGVIKVRADFSASEWHPVAVSDDSFPWCAVNPLNGRLYTSLFPMHNDRKLIAYDRNTLARCPADDIVIGPTSLDLDRIQGGVFTPRGRVLLARADYNGLFCASTLTGHVFGELALGDFGSSGSEVESVTVRPWQFGGTGALVHVLELDNDWGLGGGDDVYLHSYQVPDPRL